MSEWTRPAEIKLLSGGNPQIPKGDGDEPVQAYLDAMPEWKSRIGHHIDALVREVVPDAKRAVRWNTPFYGSDAGGWFLGMHCYTKYVQLSWLNGSELDPAPPKRSKQESVRYLDIPEDAEIDDDQLRAWIRQAASIPGEDLF